MESVSNFFEDYPYLATGLVAAVSLPLTVMVGKKLFGKKRIPECPPNTVLLFHFGRGPYAPGLSPFPLKLETYLRMAKIPYKTDGSPTFSKKNKTPFMIYNGEEVADSQFCIEYLNEKRGVDVNKDLTKEQRAVAKALQVLVDEHLYWCLAYFRWEESSDMEILRQAFSWLFRQYVRRMIRGQLQGQGIGRHSRDEVKSILMTDLQALADYLGNKPYLMGSNPCEVDCSAFGMLSQMVWHCTGCSECDNLLQDKFPSLHQYCLRMKERFWPDWDECITHGYTKKATK